MSAAAAAPARAEEVALLEHFATLDDPRQSGKVLFPLEEIVLLVVCATIADCDDNVEICEWDRHHLEFLRRFLPYRDGIPSHDTLGDVLNAIDPEIFEQCFIAWIARLRDDHPDIVLRSTKTKASMKVRRKRAAWNTDYLGDILRGEG